ncbi:MAG: glutathione S-transferase family protein [Novosphingobium sp.]
MPQVILHQYDTSPFSEKVRICLGIKELAWSAVDQPVIMPKPDLVPLTGGYRRIPVLQIGADIYCDSQLIVRELDRRYAQNPLFPPGSEVLANAVEQWCDKALFQSAVLAIFGSLGDKVDPAFVKDREALSGQPFNPAAMKALAPFAITQIKAHAALLAQQLAGGPAFLAGADPCLADAAAYYNFWFVRSFCPGIADRFDDLAGFDAWYDRVTAIGHGKRSSLTPAEALEVASNAEPLEIGALAADADLKGQTISLAATDYGRDPIVGIFAGSTQYSFTVAREVPGLGRVNVHVPRLGYSITPA